MDGVICDFHGRFVELFGVSPRSAENKKQFGEYFVEFIQGKHFATLKPMHDAFVLLQYLNSTGVPVEILSSTARPENHKEISYQKDLWLDKHKILFPRNFVPGKSNKKKFADENSIIIDDTQSIIDDWNDAGGTAIHHTDALTTISILGSLLYK